MSIRNNVNARSFAYIRIHGNLVVFIPGFDLATAICKYAHVNVHRSATYLAILDVFLVPGGPVCEDRDCLTAVRAANGDFLKLVH